MNTVQVMPTRWPIRETEAERNNEVSHNAILISLNKPFTIPALNQSDKWLRLLANYYRARLIRCLRGAFVVLRLAMACLNLPKAQRWIVTRVFSSAVVAEMHAVQRCLKYTVLFCCIFHTGSSRRSGKSGYRVGKGKFLNNSAQFLWLRTLLISRIFYAWILRIEREIPGIMHHEEYC